MRMSLTHVVTRTGENITRNISTNNVQLKNTIPILLLPVRLETRFMNLDSGHELWIRVYPDQIEINSHEDDLSKNEFAFGKVYWNSFWNAESNNDKKGAWKTIATNFGPQRAAWIVKQTTPTNINDKPKPQSPAFPNITTQEKTWGPTADGLPDRWTVVTFNGKTQSSYTFDKPIEKPLYVGPQKSASQSKQSLLAIDENMLWMTDFEAAYQAGMAMKIKIDVVQSRRGFDRLIVYGTQVSQSQDDGAKELRDLLNAHHYTDGFAFAPQGSPTNNTPDAASAFSRNDPDQEASFKTELGDPLTNDSNCDGLVAATLLGIKDEKLIENDIFAHVQYADRKDQQDAYDMAVALWPSTLGYFLNQMMADVFTSVQMNSFRDNFYLPFVRARGPIPAIRVGNTPYGILPVTSVSSWNQPDLELESGLVEFFKNAHPIWLNSANTTPRVLGTNDPDADLKGILSMDASSMTYRGRTMFGPDFMLNLAAFYNSSDAAVQKWLSINTLSGRQLLDKFGYNNWNPMIIKTTLSPDSFPILYSIVQDEPLSETQGLTSYTPAGGSEINYIKWLMTASLVDIQNDAYPEPTKPTSLLYKLLKQSYLLEYGNTSFKIQMKIGSLPADAFKEREIVVTSSDGNSTVTSPIILQRTVKDLSISRERLNNTLREMAVAAAVSFDFIYAMTDSMKRLADAKTAELDRLLTETLDVCSHRLDAWITAVANSLLHKQRKSNPTGLYLGCYGWVENLRPVQARSLVTGSEQALVSEIDKKILTKLPEKKLPPVLQPNVNNGGFIHAPSLSQAATAAILRNGDLTHRQSSGTNSFSIDLSSERVSTALWIIDGVRQGQLLGALLGYRFEKNLLNAQLGQYVQTFRDLYPLVANKLKRPDDPSPDQSSSETVAAPDVVDGYALQIDWAAGKFVVGQNWNNNLPQRGDNAQTTISQFMSELDDIMHAIGDLSIAEGVFQITQGNPTRAGGLMDAISHGDTPPDPEVINTPRGGFDLTHKVVTIFVDKLQRTNNWSGTNNPRANAEPNLDAWASSMLPDPTKVRCKVSYTDPNNTAVLNSMDVFLSDLDIGPLDILTMANASDMIHGSEIDQRILYFAQGKHLNDIHLQTNYTRDSSYDDTQLSFQQMFVAVKSLRDLIGGARQLKPEDLMVAGNKASSANIAELQSRAQNALSALSKVISDLKQSSSDLNNVIINLKTFTDPSTISQATKDDAATKADTVRAALMEASWFGVQGSIPVSSSGIDIDTLKTLYDQADSITKNLQNLYDSSSALGSKLDDLITIFKTIFGEFFVVLPLFKPNNAQDLESTFNDSTNLVSSDPVEPKRWFQQLTYVRPAISRFDSALTLAQVLTQSQLPDFTLGQLPYKQNDTWLALPPDKSKKLTYGSISIVSLTYGQYDQQKYISGLLIDEWPERIPNDEQLTGITFHYEEPKAQAPQCLLLAVCPNQSTGWTDELLVSILYETMDMAKIRTVDLDSIQDVGQILPALYFPFNLERKTFSVELAQVKKDVFLSRDMVVFP